MFFINLYYRLINNKTYKVSVAITSHDLWKMKAKYILHKPHGFILKVIPSRATAATQIRRIYSQLSIKKLS